MKHNKHTKLIKKIGDCDKYGNTINDIDYINYGFSYVHNLVQRNSHLLYFNKKWMATYSSNGNRSG
jgi:hypothetical protein